MLKVFGGAILTGGVSSQLPCSDKPELMCHSKCPYKDFFENNIKNYNYSLWGKSSFAQTMMNVVTQKNYKNFRTFRIPTEKGRHIGIDILTSDLDETSPILLFFPGNQGNPLCYKEHAQNFAKAGYRYIGYRRHADKSFFNPIGFPVDIGYCVSYIHKLYPNAPIIFYGESIGSLSMLRYLANSGDKRVKSVIAVSFVVTNCKKSFEHCSKFYKPRLLYKMKKEAGIKTNFFEMFWSNDNNMEQFFNIEGAKLSEIFKNTEINGHWNKIKCPCLLISSKDDKILLNSDFDKTIKDEICSNKQICILQTENGGHCGFFSRKPGIQRWHINTSIEYLNYILSR